MSNKGKKPKILPLNKKEKQNKKYNKMKTHTIDLEALTEWQSKEKVIFASSTKEDKQLYCTLRGSYEVWHKKEKVLETMQPFTAVEKYNSIEADS